MQLLPPDADPGDPLRVEGEPLPERDAVRILDACAAPPGASLGSDVKLARVVLAGTQAKTGWLHHGGHWCRPLGATPSTHILKLPLGALPGGAPAVSTSLENEWLCGQLLRAFGFEAAALHIEVIGPHKVLVIERIDRRWLDDRWWARLPLEDSCQASGTPPRRCAESASGPTALQLKSAGSAMQRDCNARARPCSRVQSTTWRFEMDNELHHPLTDLTAGSMLRVRDGQGRAIVVFEGQVWITQDDDQRDIVLAAGESFSADQPGLMLVEALHDSKVMLLEADPLLAAANSYALQRWAREQRSAAIGRALHKGLATLRSVFARASTPAVVRPAQRPLTVCTAGR